LSIIKRALFRWRIAPKWQSINGEFFVKITSLIAPLAGALLLATASNAAAPTVTTHAPLPQVNASAPTFPTFSAKSGRSGFSTDARVALYFGGSIIRSLHVKKVTHPGTGIYCIEPSVPLDFSDIFPLVTVDFTRSKGTGLLVFFRQFVKKQTECSSSDIEIVTVALGSKSTFVQSDNVAFILIIE
jgi:hypothetical protein